MDNILINFTSDSSGLKPGIDGLIRTKQVDQQLGEQVKKTAQEINKRDQALSTSAKASKKDVEGLATAFGNLGKSAVGGTYNKALKDLTTNLKGTKDEFKQLALVLDVAKQKLSQLDPKSEEFQALNAQIAAGQIVLQKFGEETEKSTVQTKSLKAELRSLKDEIARRTVAGETGADLDEMIAKAGELDDALKDVTQQISNTGSDTRNIEGFVQIIGASVQAVSGLQAAQSLLGDENEDFNRVLAKMNALLVLSNSVQSIQTVFQKESAASLFISNAQRKIAVIQTQLQTAAESESIAVRYAAIAAQKALNLVMSANPILLVVGAVIALGTAIYAYTQYTKEAIAIQNAFNNALDEGGKKLDAELAGIEAANARQLAAAKARGATERELTKVEIDGINQKNQARQQSLNKMIDTYNKESVLTEKNAEDHNKLGEEISRIQAEITKDVDEGNAKRGEAERQSYLSSLKSATAYSEARVTLAKKNSQAELDAQIAAIRARETEELKSNPNMTAGEAAAIRAKADKEVFDQQFARQKFLLESAKAGIDAQVLKAKEGSKEEFDFRLQSLTAARDVELQTQGLTANQKLLIQAKYEKDVYELSKSTNQKIAEDAVNSRISETQAQLSILQLNNVADTNDKVVQLKKDLVDEQAALEVISVQNSEKNEDLRRLKIKAIYDKALVDKNELEKAKRAAEIENDFSYSDKKYQAEILQNQAILLSDRSTNAERKKAQFDLNTFFQSQQDNYFNYLKSKLEAGVITEAEYYDALAQKDVDYWNNRIALVQQSTQMEAQLRQQGFDLAKQIGDGLFDINAQRYQAELDQTQSLYDRKLISEKEFNNRRDQIAKQQAQAQKQKAIFDIGIELARGLFQIQAQAAVLASNPVTAALAVNAYAQEAFLIGESVVATALVLAKKYRHGGVVEGPGTGTSDSIPIWASKGEFVTNAQSTDQHRLALEAINKNKFEEYLVKHEMPKLWSQYDMPVIPQTVEKQIEIRQSGSQIDYDRLASAIGQQWADSPHVSVHVDENGIATMIHNGLDTIEYKNKKLLM